MPGALYSRREFGKLAASALPVVSLLGGLKGLAAQARPNSVYGGVRIGVLAPFDFRTEAPDADSILKTMVRLECSSVEMQNDAPEMFAGAPAGSAALSAWRMLTPMTKFEEIRRMYNVAGVRIDAYRIQLTGEMQDKELDYAFTAAKALGADQLTMQMPMMPGSLTNQDLALTARLGKFAEKYKIAVGYHSEGQPPETLWDVPLSQSSYNRVQLDIGNFVAAHKGGDSPVPFIQKYHEKIASIHLKDRKPDGAGSFVFGQGETPVKEVLQLMKKEGYRFPAFIELGYPIPAGSTRIDEVARCLKFAKDALA